MTPLGQALAELASEYRQWAREYRQYDSSDAAQLSDFYKGAAYRLESLLRLHEAPHD